MQLRAGFARRVRRFWRDRRGATAIEYGLICALLIVAVIGVLTTLFNRIGATFNTISNTLNTH